MKNRKIGSREYKIMLDSEMFSYHGEQLLKCVRRFWSDVGSLVGSMGIPFDGVPENLLSQRLIKIYDTTEHRLHQNAYLFRERTDKLSGNREVTLKHRHPDRYLTQDRDMSVNDSKESQTKFEQDIKAPYLTLFSYSSKQPIANGKNLNKMNDPGRLFPGLTTSLDDYHGNEKLVVVNNFTTCEVVLGSAHLLLGKEHNVLAECALIFWYNMAVDTQSPTLVEFSYRYKNKKERYSGYVSQQAYLIFQELQKLDIWIDSSNLSKTEYVYAYRAH